MASKNITQEKSFRNLTTKEKYILKKMLDCDPKKEPLITFSLTEGDTWYIFRDTGVEVKVITDGKKFITSHDLNTVEQHFLNKKIFGNELHGK